ncbi:hypothetical protein MNBD_IGNAVI01-9 [hydrothermal vent metagenome]|uniref:Molybdopterin oxidoreductase n=1 Tax=hydrothermal vent metagenome TaxID=652676 RepID=A0A3B1CQ76_9ZZZZ
MINENKSADKLFWAITLIAFIIGLIAFFDRFTNGHQNANYGSYIPWGLWVAGYIYLIGLSAGAFLMSALAYVFRIKMFEKIGKLALLTALATLIGAMLSIWFDLGHMGRVWRMIIHTNFGSVMGWMAWLYGGYFILLLFEFKYALRADMASQNHNELPGKWLQSLVGFNTLKSKQYSRDKDKKTLRILGGIGIPLAIAFHGSVGAIFGSVGARPYWNSGLTPIIFLIGALLSGGALLAVIVKLWGPNRGSEEYKKILVTMGRIVLGLLAFDFLLEWAEVTIGLWASIPSETESLKMILFGHYWWVFWFVHVGLGIIVPAYLLIVKPRSTSAIAWAGGLIAITFLSVRLNIVIPGLAVPELEGLKAAFTGPGLTFKYFPSLMEWGVLIFTISVAALVFMLGKKYLPMFSKEDLSDSGSDKQAIGA